MARPVEISPSGLPRWYEQGVTALGLTSATEKEDVATEEDSPPHRTAQRFGKLVRFLREQYPDLLNQLGQIQAGSSAVLELAKIHAVSAPIADRLAKKCLNGELNVADLRARLEDLYRVNSAQQVLTRRDSSRKRAELVKATETYIRMGKLKLPYDFKVGHIEKPDSAMQMPPDFVLVEAKTAHRIAIEVQCPNLDGLQSRGQTVTRLMERMAMLKMGFYDAVLVMPEEATQLADAIVRRWTAWVGPSDGQKQKMKIELLKSAVV